MSDTDGDGEVTAELQRVDVLFGLKRFSDGVSRVSSVLASDPGNWAAWCLMAQGQLGLNDPGQALAAAERAAGLAPDEEWPRRLMSIALGLSGRHSDAVRAAEDVVRLAPNSAESHRNLGRAFLRSGQPVQAEEAAVMSLALAPNAPDGHLLVGMARVGRGDHRGAEVAFREALALDPDHAVAHNELARLTLRRAGTTTPGTLAESAEGFATAVRADPASSVSRRNLDVVIRVFLSRGAYVVSLAAIASSLLVGAGNNTVSLCIGIVLALIPIAFAARFVLALSRPLRAVLLGVVSQDRQVGAAIGLEAGAAALIVAGAAFSDLMVAWGAVILSVGARALLWESGAAFYRRSSS